MKKWLSGSSADQVMVHKAVTYTQVVKLGYFTIPFYLPLTYFEGKVSPLLLMLKAAQFHKRIPVKTTRAITDT
ncbi:hypothetical protein V9K67_08965 [Paraflavisolibacter sp. H34]|uniref:hypothetical protein n=1 Tax=Huijunlia imazamoxiresistens TaxID=3127457 RepID=UPI003015E5B4